MNPGSIWLDAPDAERAIERRFSAGEISATEATDLTKFAREGYFITKIDLPPAGAAQLDDDVNRLWREKPANVAFAYDSPPLRFTVADERAQRKPRYRIHDLHSASTVARSLYVQPVLVRYASLILDERAVATQSLYFEFGSQQALHRDSIVVPTPVFGQLLASWIALEDIDPRSGALVVVPGSHKLPFYEFAPGQYMFDGRRMGEAEARAAMQFHDDESAKRGLKTEMFVAARGEVLLWHSALLHGGGPVGDEKLTRKSLVVHYSTMRQHATREIAVSEVVDGQAGESVWSTSAIVERDGAAGFGNPLDGQLLYRLH